MTWYCYSGDISHRCVKTYNGDFHLRTKLLPGAQYRMIYRMINNYKPLCAIFLSALEKRNVFNGRSHIHDIWILPDWRLPSCQRLCLCRSAYISWRGQWSIQIHHHWSHSFSIVQMFHPHCQRWPWRRSPRTWLQEDPWKNVINRRYDIKHYWGLAILQAPPFNK